MDTAVVPVNLEDFKKSLSATQERILSLLGAGITPVQVAQAVGITEAYVIQLLSDENFSALVTKLRSDRAGKFIEHDESIEELEQRALTKLSNLLPLVTRPVEALRIFQTLNQAKRKTDPTGGLAAQGTPGVVVQLELPEDAPVHFKLTVDKQVIEVEGRSMVPMPAAQVSKMLKEKQTLELLESTLTKEEIKTTELLKQL